MAVSCGVLFAAPSGSKADTEEDSSGVQTPDYPAELDKRRTLRAQEQRIRELDRLLLAEDRKLERERRKKIRKHPELYAPDESAPPQMLLSTGLPPEDHCFFYDGDADGDVDMSDFGYIQVCLSGAGVPLSGEQCERFDPDGDGDVDSADLNEFFNCTSGPAIRYAGFLPDRYYAIQILRKVEEAILGASVRDPLALSIEQKANLRLFLASSESSPEKGMAILEGQAYYPISHIFPPNIPLDGGLFLGLSENLGAETIYKLGTRGVVPSKEIEYLRRSNQPANCSLSYASGYMNIDNDLRCVYEQALEAAYAAGDEPNKIPDIQVNTRVQSGVAAYLAGQIQRGNIVSYDYLQTSSSSSFSPYLRVVFPPAVSDRGAVFLLELTEESLYGPAFDIEEIARQYNELLLRDGLVIVDGGVSYVGEGKDIIDALALLISDSLDFRTKAIAAIDIFRFGTADVSAEPEPVTLKALLSYAPQAAGSITPDSYYDQLGGHVVFGPEVAVFDIARWANPSKWGSARYQGLYMLSPFGYNINHFKYSFVNTKMINRLVDVMKDDRYQIIYIIAHGGNASTGHEMLLECWDSKAKAEARKSELAENPEIAGLDLKVSEGCSYYDPNVDYDEDPEWKTGGWGIWISGVKLFNSGPHARRKGIVFNHSCFGGFCPSSPVANWHIGVGPTGKGFETVSANDMKLFAEFWTTKREDPRHVFPWAMPGLHRDVHGTYLAVGTKYSDGAAYNGWAGAWIDDYDDYIKGICRVYDPILKVPVQIFCLDRWAGGTGPNLHVAPQFWSLSMNPNYRGLTRLYFNTLVGDCPGGFGEGCGAANAISIDYSQCIAGFETMPYDELSEQYFEPFYTEPPSTLPLCSSPGNPPGCRDVFYKAPYWENGSTIAWSFNWETGNDYYVSIFDEERCDELPPIQDCTTEHGYRILSGQQWENLPRPPADQPPGPQPSDSNADWQKNWNRFLKIRINASQASSWPAGIKFNGNTKAGSGKYNRNYYGTHYYDGTARKASAYKAWDYYNGYDSPGGDFEVWIPCQPPRIDYISLCYGLDDWPDTIEPPSCE